jgi:hypothetical protein
MVREERWKVQGTAGGVDLKGSTFEKRKVQQSCVQSGLNRLNRTGRRKTGKPEEAEWGRYERENSWEENARGIIRAFGG